MPNIAAQFGDGYLYLFSRTTCSSKLVSLFQNLGTAPIIDEKLMDAATRLAASGTAFVSYALQCASMQAGIEIGKPHWLFRRKQLKVRLKC
jgi:pyrroline-5-carboxylate reductase